MWFGAKERTVVFAFPGNPVSTVMCAVRYLIPWLNMSLGKINTPTRHAQLAKPTENKTGLTFYVQVKTLWNDRATLTATPISGNGSGDFSNLTEADGFLELPPGPRLFNEGEIFPFYAYR
jgi:molybdopterin molybdotransferase